MTNKLTLGECFGLLDNLIEKDIPFVIDLETKGKRGKATFMARKVKRVGSFCLLIERGRKRNGTMRYSSLNTNTKIKRFVLYLC